MPKPMLRRIHQKVVSLDPGTETQEVRSTARSHCKSQLCAVGADRRNSSILLVGRRTKNRCKGHPEGQIHGKLLPNG